MENITWGLLGPEVMSGERRTRTLGLGASVRAFNELAVPGIGGTWFGKQLFLATLGVAVAEKARALGKRVHNIETANAIEALACFLAFNTNSWKSDSRLLGITKMQGKENDIRFEILRKPGFYVTQPMRMATVQALPSLGLVESNGSRFNAFICSQTGCDFIEAQSIDYNPCHYSRSIFDFLVAWTMGESVNISTNDKLRRALSPLEPMTKRGCEVLRDRLIQGSIHENLADKERRRSALEWVDTLRTNPNQSIDWEAKPSIINVNHWHDLHTGSLFFATRDAAIQTLDLLEAHISNHTELEFKLGDSLPDNIKASITVLRECAQKFLSKEHNDELGNSFCRECVDELDSVVLANIVKRDERVLRLRGRLVLPGPAFRNDSNQEITPSDEDETEETGSSKSIKLPDGISHRVRNFFLLNADLNCELHVWLGQNEALNVREEL